MGTGKKWLGVTRSATGNQIRVRASRRSKPAPETLPGAVKVFTAEERAALQAQLLTKKG